MSLNFEYGKHAVTLPALPDKLSARASKTELQFLLALANDPTLMADYDAHADALAATLKTTRATLDAALRFWEGAGILCREDGDAEAAKTTESEALPKTTAPVEPPVSIPRRTVTTELPRYTADELNAVMTHRKNAQNLVDEAQKALGLIFTSHSQISQLMGIAEGLGLSDEYLLILFAHCREKGKNNLRYAEKLAVSLYDADITTAEALSEHLRALEQAESAEGQIKRLFGLSRSLTGKEKGFVADWTVKYGFGTDMLEKAYEFAVDATANPTLNYVNSILTRWHEQKITTPDAAERERDAHRAAAEQTAPKKTNKKAPPTADAASFNVDEFFEVAISRGYENITGKKDK